jgi:hypothetical protein
MIIDDAKMLIIFIMENVNNNNCTSLFISTCIPYKTIGFLLNGLKMNAVNIYTIKLKIASKKALK